MGLNAIIKSFEQTEADAAVNRPQLNDKERDCATYIFFNRMLKDINHGMGEAKIDEMITRSITIAQMLHKRLYE